MRRFFYFALFPLSLTSSSQLQHTLQLVLFPFQRRDFSSQTGHAHGLFLIRGEGGGECSPTAIGGGGAQCVVTMITSRRHNHLVPIYFSFHLSKPMFVFHLSGSYTMRIFFVCLFYEFMGLKLQVFMRHRFCE